MKILVVLILVSYAFSIPVASSFVAEESASSGSESSKGVSLGESGYVLHQGKSEKDDDEYAIALYAKESGMPSLTLVVSAAKKETKVTFMKDYGDKVIFYTDTDGDGLPDEGIERDKVKRTLKKFKIRCSFEEMKTNK
jgi:hypothetical protein